MMLISRRRFSKSIKSMISNIQQKREQRSDFNEQYAKLDERKVEVTLKDIYRDYRNYRNAYYFISTK